MAGTSRIHVPLLEPSDVIPHLGKGELHWKTGRSARLLAEQWFAANQIPSSVRDVLASSTEWDGATLVDAFLERVTELPWGAGKGTQTDLLATVSLHSQKLGVLGVEAKVDETFGPKADAWLSAGGRNRENRLRGLCEFLEITFDEARSFRYQFFHRLAGTVLEAHRYRADQACMLVQSWCPNQSGWEDFSDFAKWAGFGDLTMNTVSKPRRIGNTDLIIGWVAQ